VLVTVPKGVAAEDEAGPGAQGPAGRTAGARRPVGTLKMMVDGKPLLALPVVALEEVPEASIFGRAWDSMRLWMK
jgi:D-alanyl-D-alanine carboxypeptidase (penicillin-binding protein 5/6)